jgi:hypothetical protein
LITKSDTSVAKKSFFRDLDKGLPENYSLGNSSFDFSFKVSGGLTEDIGYFTGFEVM